MRFFGDLRVQTKIIGAFLVLLVVFLSSVFLYLFLSVRGELTRFAVEKIEREAWSHRLELQSPVDEFEHTILAMRRVPPIQGIVRARDNDGFDEEGSSTLGQWKNRLEAVFESQLLSTGLYFQLRYIDEYGQELVRVDYRDGVVKKIKEEDLQNKSDRDYFKEAMELSEGEVYRSHAELNREGSPPVISEPHTPVVRYATPIFAAATGERRGMIIANVFLNEVLLPLKLNRQSGGATYVARLDGEFFVHPEPKKEWGADLQTGENLFSEYPIFRSIDFQKRTGTLVTEEDIFAYGRIEIDASGDKDWLVIEQAKKHAVFAPFDAILRNILLVQVGSVGIFALFFFFFIRRILQPLQPLSLAVEKIRKRDFDIHLAATAKDEIGRIAEGFNQMAQDLATYYRELETRVQDRTKELVSKKEELQEQRQAILNILEDVQDEKLEAQRQFQKNALILSTMADGVFVMSPEGVIEFMNKAGLSLLGYTREHVESASLFKALKPALSGKGLTQASWEAMLERMKEGMVKGEKELQFTKQNHRRLNVGLITSPLVVDGVLEGIIGVFRDVTREREIDRMKTEFVSVASHQLRTPLSAIRWYGEMLLAGDAGKLNEEQVSFVQQLYDSSKRMISLVNSLLNVSRIESGRIQIDPEPTDLIGLVDEVIQSLTPMVEKKQLQITVSKNPTLKKVNLDPRLVREVYANLLTNAVKYTPAKGDITVFVSVKDDQILTQVTDTGYGIPKEQQKRIFDRFFRADNVVEKETDGTGLGLYITKAIVESSGGKIWFESEENKGTTFWFTLPKSGMIKKKGDRTLIETARAEPASGSEAETSSKKKKSKS